MKPWVDPFKANIGIGEGAPQGALPPNEGSGGKRALPPFAEIIKPLAKKAAYLDNNPKSALRSGVVFSHEDWQMLLNQSVAEIKKLGTLKGGEYAGDVDRLANFRRNGASLGLPMETVWAVYAGKHWDAVQQYVQDQRNGKQRERMEPIAGRVDDLLVYLLLFKAMLVERGELALA